MNIKLLLGILSIIPAIAAYYLYFRNMFKGKTKPHTFSWLIWGILSGNGFFAQVSAHAGIGAWATGLTSVASLSIFVFSLRTSTTRPSQFDWTLLSLALASLTLLLIVRNKDIALSITLAALVCGFAMTIRKAYRNPKEENAVSFWLNTLKFVPAIFAVTRFAFLTIAYPLVAALGNMTIASVVNIQNKKRPAQNSNISR